jgi:hypothetical protein
MDNFKITFMINYITTLILLISIFSCKAQNKNPKTATQKKDTMEYFDKNKYDKLAINIKTNLKTLPNGDEVYIDEGAEKNEIVLKIEKKNTPFQDYYEYYDNNVLKIKSTLFYGIQFGIRKEYERTGKLIKETNFEKNYKFSIENVCELIKREYGLDLIKKSSPNDSIRYWCNRIKSEVFKGDERYCYYVTIGINIEGGAGKIIAIDGNTGKILYETTESGFGAERLPKSKTPILTPEGIIKK